MRIVKSRALRGASYIKTRIWYSIHMMGRAGRETEKLIEELIVQFHMIEHGDVVIAGVSGGADSVCLLLTLCSLREKFGFEVKVCHVNHCLRGADADEDEEYVKKLCGELGVECRVFRKEVELIAEKRKQSCEEAGREVRREAFEQMCAENGGTKIATAHHRGDQAETVLLNITRGTGIRGLCGIVPVRGNRIRPLLSLTRDRIESYLRERGIVWRIDATNEEDDYTRNRIRHKVLPVLENEVNDQTVKHLESLSRQAEEICEYLDYGVRQLWKTCVSVRKKKQKYMEPPIELAIEKESFLQSFPAVRKLLLQKCIGKVRGGQKDLASVHIQAVLELFDRQVGKSVDLPGGVTAKRTYGGVEITKQAQSAVKTENMADTEKTENIADTEKTENIADTADTGNMSDTAEPANAVRMEEAGKRVSLRFVEDGDILQAEEIPQKSYTKWIDYDIIKCGLCVRTRQSGDYFVIDDQGRRQKLKAWFINEKIPKEERDRMLLVADGSHIVWIPGHRMSREYKVTEKTRNIVEIKITEEEKDGRNDQRDDFGRES